MQLIVEQTYPAPVDVVIDMLSDPKFVRWQAAQVSNAVSVDQAEVDLDERGGMTIIVRRTLPTDLIPAQARGLIGDSVEIRQAEVWDAPVAGHAHRRGTVAVEIVGAPLRITGTVALDPLPDGGARKTYSGEVKVTLPLFGQVVEEAAVKTLRRALAQEETAGRHWLTNKEAPADEHPQPHPG
ncbi:MAG: DUF2505 domain-containing protein [Promicromonosporaceae bacterium]|nr:DUF2505 domain-containing protein [Promicromonosporaceae bacterium]